MKARAFALALLLLPMAPALAAQGMAMDKEAAAAAHRATGVVKSVDPAKGTLSIAHGPVATLNWPAMTMTFTAQDRKALQNLKPGTKVEFEFRQQGSRYVVTSIK
jgi:Cu(I)/Ag(I) efflux system protein CusF